jgi:hypothetical protein
MSAWLLEHHHDPRECGVAFAAWKGFHSPLRSRAAMGTCREGGHSIWWTVEAKSAEEALSQLPGYLAERTRATRISEVAIP